MQMYGNGIKTEKSWWPTGEQEFNMIYINNFEKESKSVQYQC